MLWVRTFVGWMLRGGVFQHVFLQLVRGRGTWWIARMVGNRKSFFGHRLRVRNAGLLLWDLFRGAEVVCDFRLEKRRPQPDGFVQYHIVDLFPKKTERRGLYYRREKCNEDFSEYRTDYNYIVFVFCCANYFEDLFYYRCVQLLGGFDAMRR